jgi:hypothetical protein
MASRYAQHRAQEGDHRAYPGARYREAQGSGAAEAIPHQTLIASILHQYAEGALKEEV